MYNKIYAVHIDINSKGVIHNEYQWKRVGVCERQGYKV